MKLKLHNGDTVKLSSGTVYSNIQRCSKAGHRWIGRIILDCGRNDTKDVGRIHMFHDNGVIEILT